VDARFWTERLETIFEDWEVCLVKERDKKYEAADGEILTMELKEEEGISLRAMKDGKRCFSYTFEKGEKAVSSLLGNITALMPFVDADPCDAFPPGSEQYPDLDLYDEAGLRTADGVKIDALLQMESTIRAVDRRITHTRNCELHESELHVGIINSRGVRAHAKKTVYTLGAMAVAQDGSDEVSWYDWSWASRYRDLDGRKLGSRIAEKALSCLSGEVLTTGVYHGLLTPAAACQILEVLSPSFLSENLYKNKTCLRDKVGTRCFSALLTVLDSGLRGTDAFPFDGEGVPSQENVLVKEGVLQTFLYDTYYAKRMEKASTGNSVRHGIKEPPRCGSRGFFIDRGRGDDPEVGSGGVVVEELMGAHMANTITGDFSLGAVGHYYSGAAPTPFKGVILSGNLFDLLGQVSAVGKDLTFYGPYGSPTLLVEGLKISGR
jgi:PmbA protein